METSKHLDERMAALGTAREAALARFALGGEVVATRLLAAEPGAGHPGESGTVVKQFYRSADEQLYKVQWTRDYAAWHSPADLLPKPEWVANGADFGGHVFEYNDENDLFQCVRVDCEKYEVVVRDTWTKKIQPCASAPAPIAEAASEVTA